METKQIIANIFEHDFSWAIPDGMILASYERIYGNEDDLDWDELVYSITYGTPAEVVESWGVPLISESYNLSQEPLFPKRPRYINRKWLQSERQQVALLES